jgi:hypothetical protein
MLLLHIRADALGLAAQLGVVMRLQAELQGAGRADLLCRLWTIVNNRLLPRACEQQLQPHMLLLSTHPVPSLGRARQSSSQCAASPL